MSWKETTIKELLEPVRDGRAFRWVARTAAKRWVGVLLAFYAFATDWLTGWHGMNFAMRGLLDWPAHLATALVILGTLVRVRRTLPDQRFGWTMLACSVLIDLDHLPAELGSQVLTNGTPRPYTHALWTVIVLALAWTVARLFVIRSGRPRPATIELILGGAASGVAAHFVRDITTAPMSFWWPLTDISVEVPYWCYVVALAVFIVIGPSYRTWPLNYAAIATAKGGDLEASESGESGQEMTRLTGPQSLSPPYDCHTFTDLMASVPLHVPVPLSVSAKFMITYIAW